MLDVRSSLLETGLADDRFHVTDYLGDCAYPDHRAEKDKAERYVAYVVAAMDRGDATQLPTTCATTCARCFGSDELDLASADADLFERQVRFAALQRGLDDALYRRPSLPMGKEGVACSSPARALAEPPVTRGLRRFGSGDRDPKRAGGRPGRRAGPVPPRSTPTLVRWASARTAWLQPTAARVPG